MRSRPQTQTFRAAALVLAALATVALAGCGQDGSAAAPPSTSAPRPAVTVDFGEYYYRPKMVTVHVGQPVRFVNAGKIAHTVADSTASGEVRSVLIQPRPLERGQSQTVTFPHAGKVGYLCTFHPTLMSGTITVTP